MPYTDLEQFYRSLKLRGLNQEKLAKRVPTGRAHLCEVLNNKPGHGGKTRPKLFPHLLPGEIALLGWTEEYERWLANQKERRAA